MLRRDFESFGALVSGFGAKPHSWDILDSALGHRIDSRYGRMTLVTRQMAA